jgi:hypothetical protein
MDSQRYDPHASAKRPVAGLPSTGRQRGVMRTMPMAPPAKSRTLLVASSDVRIVSLPSARTSGSIH